MFTTTALGLYEPAGTTFAAFLLVVVIAVAIMLIGGGHGPGAHMPGEGGG